MGSSNYHAKYESLRRDHVAKDTLYRDPEFPPVNSSVYYSIRDPNIVWKRPSEIVDNPKFFVEGHSRFDLYQGSISNCWYVAAAANIAMYPELIKKVVPAGQTFSKGFYAGIWRFRFWQYGKWVDVIIDDLLPCRRISWSGSYDLIFCSNRGQPDEMWPALLEKAYAKLHGSYEALNGGWPAEAFVDFTGGVGDQRDLTDDETKKEEDLFDYILKNYKMNSLMACAIVANDQESFEKKLGNGLVMGHAYGITKVTKLELSGVKHKLIRMRNPWGEGEWNGAWSDKSYEMGRLSGLQKRELGATDMENGEFWMSYEDWIKNWERFDVCLLPPDMRVGNKYDWIEHCHSGEWVKGVSAGGCGNEPYRELFWTNPQYVVTLKDVDDKDDHEEDGKKATLVVNLMQAYRRRMRTETKVTDTDESIGFTVYKIKQGWETPLNGSTYSWRALKVTAYSGKYTFMRSCTRHYKLEPGHYCIIPSTYLPYHEAEFLLRLYTPKEIKSKELDETIGPITKPKESSASLWELYRKYGGDDYRIDAEELRNILNEAFSQELGESHEFDLEASRSLLAMLDIDKSGLIEFKEVKQIWTELQVWKTTYQQFDKNRTGYIEIDELRSVFKAVGYQLSRSVTSSIVRRYGGKKRRLSFSDFVIVMTKVVSMIEIFSKYSENLSGKAELTLDEWMSVTMSI